nr:hypothetical protein [Candidatus Babeliales bacterium]
MLAFFISVIFSVISTGMMSYLTMNTQVGPWVAPVFSVVCMTFMMPLFSTEWLRKYAVVIICAGSIGGMVGTCLGLSFPSFYFLHPKTFEIWISSPYIYVYVLSGFILAAAAYAFLISYVMRRYYIDKASYDFPMSQLVHDVIVVRRQQDTRILMFFGIVFSTLFNVFVTLGRFALQAYTVQVHMAPLVVSLGFMIGKEVAYPILLGLFTRVVTMHVVHQYVPVLSTDRAFLVTFCSGMLLFWFVQMVWSHIVGVKWSRVVRTSWWSYIPWQRWFLVLSLFVAMFLLWFFTMWHVPYIEQLYVVVIVLMLAMYMVKMVANVGIIEIDSYVWFLILPLVYSL